MSKPVILTGLRANNDLHIGNYLGALLPIVDMAKRRAGEYQVNLFVPDLHSFTTPIDHDGLQAGIRQNLRVFAAAGLPLDNPDVHLYRQSYVPAHSELTWILDCFTGMGEMQRMTQFKSKAVDLLGQGGSVTAEIKAEDGDLVHSQDQASKNDEERHDRISVGLFNYPVMMAADILLYGAEYVPVGDDQTQHLEFARDVAERLNNKFGELFTVPKPVKQQHEFFGKDQGLRIKDLADPAKKMSKSEASGKGVIFLTDTPDEAKQKIMAATTDSVGKITYDQADQPGIANLMDILALFGGRDLAAVRQEYDGQTQYGPLKDAVAEAMGRFLSAFQAELAKVDDQAITDKLVTSEKLMNEQANSTLLKVQQAVGLRG